MRFAQLVSSAYSLARHSRAFRIFLLATLLTFGLEQFAERQLEESHGTSSPSILDGGAIYPRLLDSWRSTVPHATTLVLINPDADPTAISLRQTCEQRGYMAALLGAVAAQEPAVIVIDKYFTAKTECPDTTPRLQAAFADVSRRIPMVVGISIHQDAAPHDVDGKDVYEVEPPLELAGAPVRVGAVNVDLDSRRLPLGWTIRREPGAKPENIQSLSMEAALAYEPNLLRRPRAWVLKGGNDPYISLMTPADFDLNKELAGDVLCRDPKEGPGLAAKCAALLHSSAPSLRGKIVLIGELSREMDSHATVIGTISGSYLQANYIEALLDDRLFAPAPRWVNYLVGFIFFALFEWALTAKSTWKCLGGVTLVIVGVLLFSATMARVIGYFVNPVTFTFLVLALNIIVWMRRKVMEIGRVDEEQLAPR